MRAHRFTLQLANGLLVNGPIQGCGGVLTLEDLPRLQMEITKATEGEPIGIYEPEPGHAKMLPDLCAASSGEPMHIDLRNARVIIFENEIPLDLARRAHAGTSYAPEERGDQERAMYANQLSNDLAMLQKLADTDEKRIAVLFDVRDGVASSTPGEFARYADGYRTRYIARLQAMSRCMSTMITGGSNFPVRQNAKRVDSSEKRTTELIEFRNRALAAIRRILTPEDRPIMAGDADAVERTESKLEKAEKLQEIMTKANAAIRKHAKAGAEAQTQALRELGLSDVVARNLLKPDDFGRIGFADFQLKNNGANIRRMKARGEQLADAKGQETVVLEGEHARFEDCPPDNRVRLFFPGKPSAEQRSSLKSAGFRWTPSLGCWQAYRNHRSLEVARRKAGIAAEPQASASAT